MSFNSTSAIGTLLYISLFLFCLSIFVEAYDPVDRFSINCGSSGKSYDGDRSWTGDINSKLLTLEDSQTTTAQAKTQASSANQVPYTTARLSPSDFSYSFPVTAGQKFVRLFFYPASYPGFDRPNAFFTVKSGEFTLLKDFNASLNADAAQSDTIFKEYIVNVDDGQRINLTFTPTTSYPNAYAFINGIEVVSMPDDLHYTSPNDQGTKLVGSSSSGILYSIDNSRALETDYRINVGGQTMTPKNDTGMLRLWQGDDADYLRTPTAAYLTGGRNITVNPDYVAPKELYRISRDMGTNGDLNKKSNLTWEFPVDSGFFYMLRLHFCELDPNINYPSNRAFFIYIAGQVAEDHADVLRWSKQKGVAVHRDYVIMIQGSQKKVNLSLQMHPLPDSEYSDPFLNGLEIFKISDPESINLAGPNPDQVPDQHTPANQPNSGSNSKSSSAATIIGVVAGVASGVVLLSAVAIEKREDSDDIFSSGTSVGQVSDFNKSSGVSMMSSSADHSYSNKDSDKLMSGTVFSEIMDPKAR